MTVAQNRGGLFVVLAVVLGLSAALLIFMVLSSARSGRTRGLVPVVVASSDLTYGTKLEQAQLRVVNFPKESVPEGTFSDIDSVVGNTTKIFLAAREPVLRSKLSTVGGGLSMMVEPTMRASSVDVKLSSSVSGFVVPGDRVDVLCTIDRQGGEMNEAVTRTILQNVQVLAAGPRTEQKEKQDKPSDMQTVTLLVDPKGAETLALGMHEGKIHLTLRNPEDSDTLTLAAVNTRQILGSAAASAPAQRVSRAPAKKPAPEPVKPAAAPVVQAPKPEPYKPSVIKGGKITTQEPTQK
jgi:pilus assembly protein CpaB